MSRSCIWSWMHALDLNLPRVLIGHTLPNQCIRTEESASRFFTLLERTNSTSRWNSWTCDLILGNRCPSKWWALISWWTTKTRQCSKLLLRYMDVGWAVGPKHYLFSLRVYGVNYLLHSGKYLIEEPKGTSQTSSAKCLGFGTKLLMHGLCHVKPSQILS